MTQERERRWFLRSTALAAAAGLAGCSEDGAGGDGAATTATDTPTRTPTEQQPQVSQEPTDGDQTPHAAPRQAVDDWLSNVDNYGGSLEDRTGQTSTTIDVGVRTPGGDYFAYGPPAIAVTEGTTVQWLWTGDGGSHSVTERSGAFDSGTPQSSSGVTFTREFAEPGVYLYRCENHGEAAGMRGAVVVRERQSLSDYPKVDEWLDGYNYDGQLADRRGEGSVTVTAGASGNDGHFAFAPNAVLVSQGTEVTFEWSGRGGAHDVTWADSDLPESDSTSSAAYTFSVTMNESGVYRYFCDGHGPTGGRGAIVVD